MDEIDPVVRWSVQLPVLLAGVVVAVLLVWGGCLRRRALDAGPGRVVSLGMFDLLVGAFLYVAGTMAFIGVAQWLVNFDPELGRMDGGAETLAWIGLLGQAMRYGPVLVYLGIRVGAQANGWREFGLLPRRPVGELGFSLVGLIVAVPLVAALLVLGALVGEWMGDPPPLVGHELLEEILATDSRVALAVMAISAILVAAVTEEVVFRGLGQTVLVNLLGKRWRWAVVIGVGVFFGVIHLGAVTWHALPALCVLGVLLGWLYERTGSLWPPILVHMGFNAVNVGQVLLLRGTV